MRSVTPIHDHTPAGSPCPLLVCMAAAVWFIPINTDAGYGYRHAA